MSAFDYKALAERVAQRAIYADNNADPNNKAWAADLRAVVSLLNGMADAQPVAWRCEVRDLLTQAEQCLSTAVQFEQWAHDEPPSYLSAWDYEADHIAAEIRAMLAAAPAAPQAEPTRDWSAIDAAIREYLDGYEQIGENDAGADACYTPTERELYLIYDAINGLLADESFVAAISTPQAEPDDDDALVLGEPDMLTPEDVRRLVPQAEPKRGLTCLWSRADDDTDTWETACRHAFTLIEGTPTDNSMAFCCYCGRPLEQEIGDSDE